MVSLEEACLNNVTYIFPSNTSKLPFHSTNQAYPSHTARCVNPSVAAQLEGLNMAPSYPSIQSFYKRETTTSAKNGEEQQPPPKIQGDGFTEEELADALDPLKRKWNPEREYEESTIDKLIPGPKAVTFMGRVVNLSTIYGRSQKQPKATGWHYLIVKDDTAAISVCILPSQLHAYNAALTSSPL